MTIKGRNYWCESILNKEINECLDVILKKNFMKCELYTIEQYFGNL
jgi:hypothetical protein